MLRSPELRFRQLETGQGGAFLRQTLLLIRQREASLRLHLQQRGPLLVRPQLHQDLSLLHFLTVLDGEEDDGASHLRADDDVGTRLRLQPALGADRGWGGQGGWLLRPGRSGNPGKGERGGGAESGEDGRS